MNYRQESDIVSSTLMSRLSSLDRQGGGEDVHFERHKANDLYAVLNFLLVKIITKIQKKLFFQRKLIHQELHLRNTQRSTVWYILVILHVIDTKITWLIAITGTKFSSTSYKAISNNFHRCSLKCFEACKKFDLNILSYLTLPETTGWGVLFQKNK